MKSTEEQHHLFLTSNPDRSIQLHATSTLPPAWLHSRKEEKTFLCLSIKAPLTSGVYPIAQKHQLRHQECKAGHWYDFRYTQDTMYNMLCSTEERNKTSSVKISVANLLKIFYDFVDPPMFLAVLQVPATSIATLRQIKPI